MFKVCKCESLLFIFVKTVVSPHLVHAKRVINAFMFMYHCKCHRGFSFRDINVPGVELKGEIKQIGQF